MRLMKKLAAIFSFIFIFSFSITSFADRQDNFLDYLRAVEYMLEKNRDKFSRKNVEKLDKFLQDSLKEINDSNSDYTILDLRIKRDIEKNLHERNHNFTVYIKDYYKEDKLTDIFQKALESDKYFYYAVYKSASISTNYFDRQNEAGDIYIEDVDFKMTYRQSIEDEKKIDAYVDNFLQENIDQKMDDLEKIKTIHDFIVKKNNYNTGDSEGKSSGYSIYAPSSILFGDGGVCNAYATLFDKMAQKAGLSTYYVTGQIKDDGQLHIWNMVKLYDNWYNLDLTWDDPVLNSSRKILNRKDFVSYDYFLVSDENILKTRSIDYDKYKPYAKEDFDHNFENTKVEFGEKLAKIYYKYRRFNDGIKLLFANKNLKLKV